MKKVKMFTYKGYWVVTDGDRLVPFKKSYDAWQYILLLKAIRPKVPYIRSLYPVKALDPSDEFVGKKVIINC